MFVVTVLSGGFHEFGHAAAARYGGADPGVMGAGLYIVWPAFYTDVTDSYRLGRAGRIRTDLGGLYFNALVVVLTFGWWYFTGWDALLLLVATQTLQMVQQLLPLLRFDGYHVLADLTGVPDLWHRIGPTLRGLLPHRWSDPEHKVLKPWARAVITLWVLVTIPMMALMLLALVAAIPRLVGTAWAVVDEDAAGVMSGWRSGGFVDVSSHALQVLGVVLPLLGGLLIFGRMTLRSSRGLARWSQGSASKRVLAAALTAVVVTGLSWAWSQPGAYRPIVPGEDGRLTALLSPAAAPGAPRPAPLEPAAAAASETLPIGAAAERRLSSGAPLAATFPEGQPLPTESEPQLAAVLVPSEDTDTDTDEPPTTDGSDEPWVFPFDKPLPPEEGDNQAAAYNTTDGSMKYDVAFALIWAEGDEVLNVNEAHAYASCNELRHGRRRLPGGADHGRRPGGGPPEPRRGRQLPVLPLHHGRDRQPARAVRAGDTRRGAAARTRRGLEPVDGVRAEHHVVLPRGDLGPARRIPDGDHRDPRRRAPGAAHDSVPVPHRRTRRRHQRPVVDQWVAQFAGPTSRLVQLERAHHRRTHQRADVRTDHGTDDGTTVAGADLRSRDVLPVTVTLGRSPAGGATPQDRRDRRAVA